MNRCAHMIFGVLTACSALFFLYTTDAHALLDVTPPSAIINLIVGNAAPNALTLTWAAVGDNGLTGRAAAHRVRYATTPILTDSAWDAATPATISFTPGNPGEHQGLTISGLNANTTYYFAVRSSDAAGNLAALSNAAFGTTLADQSGASAVTAPSTTTTTESGNVSTTSLSTTTETPSLTDSTLVASSTTTTTESGSVATTPPSTVETSPSTSPAPLLTAPSQESETLGVPPITTVSPSPDQGGGSANQKHGLSSPVSDHVKSTAAASAKPLGPLTASIEGRVTDALGLPVARAFIDVYHVDSNRSFTGSTDSNGFYRIAVALGSYKIKIFSPGDRFDLVQPSPQYVVVREKETLPISFQLSFIAGGGKELKGSVRFGDGSPVRDAFVRAYNTQTGQWMSAVVDVHGSYRLPLAPGTWSIAAEAIDAVRAHWRSVTYGTINFRENNNTRETSIVDFVIPLSNAGVFVRVLDARGQPLDDVGIFLEVVRGAGEASVHDSLFHKTDSQGIAQFTVFPGSYRMRVVPPAESGFVPDERVLVLRQGVDEHVQFILPDLEKAKQKMIHGRAVVGDKSAEAFVWGWSAVGSYVHAQANRNGNFTLLLTRGTLWHVGASAVIDGLPYKSAEMMVNVDDEKSDALLLTLVRAHDEPLPSPVAVSGLKTETLVAHMGDGATVTIPPGTVEGSGVITVAVAPTIETPSQAHVRVVSKAYDIVIQDNSGRTITQFKQPIDIVFPYDESDLVALGITAEMLVPSFFDADAAAWIAVDNYVLDKERSLVIARVAHLTRFALVVPADITPPPTATGVSARLGASSAALLSWINPSADFHHVKVYRADKMGVDGTLLNDLVIGTNYEDATIVKGKTYYYQLRVVDAAGNESPLTRSVALRVDPEAVSASSAVLFTRSLGFGARGNQVEALQRRLQALGFFPNTVFATGFFGNITVQAVKALQEAHGFDAVGVVGPKTRALLNKL